MAWHIAALPRLPEMPELHDLTGREPPAEETNEERAERIYRNSMAWVIVTGGAQTEPAEEPEGTA
jgi:hydroxymethylpyrimidine/phosphomethylpyrimidine kinase